MKFLTKYDKYLVQEVVTSDRHQRIYDFGYGLGISIYKDSLASYDVDPVKVLNSDYVYDLLVIDMFEDGTWDVNINHWLNSSDQCTTIDTQVLLEAFEVVKNERLY